MTEDEKYFFDPNGYLILRDVADPELVARCNAAIDHHDNQIETAVRQRWSDDIIRWDKPWREGFLDLLVHLRLKPYLSELLGSGYRMAYLPRLLMMDTGDGGLAIVPCSHKSNFPMPQSLSFYEEHQEYVQEVDLEAGDVVIFTEAMTHGTLVWQGEHQRRALIYKYSPRFQYLAEGYHQTTYPDFIQDMSEEQRALMPPPA